MEKILLFERFTLNVSTLLYVHTRYTNLFVTIISTIVHRILHYYNIIILLLKNKIKEILLNGKKSDE